MTVTITSFVADFPEFGDATNFPGHQITLWLNFAVSALAPAQDRWGDFLDLGTELLMAHNLALGAKDRKARRTGGIGGSASGPVNSKSVDKVSVSYDTAAGTLADGGAYNLTSYGVRFLQLARMVGTGGIQL